MQPQPTDLEKITKTATVLAADGAQANIAFQAVPPNVVCVCTGLKVFTDGSNSVPVAVRVGFGAATVPAAAATPVKGVLLDHPGVAAGGGLVEVPGDEIGRGEAGEELRFSCEAPTGGAVSITASYYLIPA